MAAALMTSLPVRMRLTLILLCDAFGELCRKQVHKHDLPHIQVRAVQAICLLELRFPASEADVALYDTGHIAFDNLPCWGGWS